jgi:type I restriction enzyme S subunit
MFGDPVKNCKQWRIVFFSKGIDSIKYGTSIPPEFSDFGYPFIRATNVKNGGIASDNMLFISEIEAKKIKKCKLILGDIIIVRSGANTGDNAVVNTEYEGAYAAYDIIIRMNNLFHPIFINGVLNSVYKEAVISPLKRRAGQPHLNTTQINNLPIYLPPFELQNKFADIVEQVEQIKQKMRASLDEMGNHFNALMQRYF